MILLIDNYDSFTFNIYQMFSKFNHPIKVIRNDKISIEEIKQINPQYIIIGPGPKTPQEAGISIKIVQELKGIYPILGICLGHQAILAAFDVPIVNAKHIVHGKIEPLEHNSKGIFRNISPNTPIVRYHSLAAKSDDIPDFFEISAKTHDGEVMAVEHKSYQLIGLQFHPESIGTNEGEKMILNFLHYRRETIPIKTYLKKALNLLDMDFQEAYNIMDELTEGNMSDAQIGSLFTSLEIKGIKAEELAGFASILKKKAISFPLPIDGEKRLDIVGTGGSPNKTFNVSTTSSLILAARGVNIIKHGNRAITSQSGSADLLEKLGININMSVENCIECYKKLGITFLFATKFHSALAFASNARKSLGFKTAFNLIGPLANPAAVTHQFIGVFNKNYTEIMAEALNILGIKRAMIVSGFDEYDEISLSAPTKITELKDGKILSYDFTPLEVGLDYVPYSMLRGGDADTNKQITLDIFNNIPSVKNDLVCLNAGAALYMYGLANSIKDGYMQIKETLKSKKVFEILEEFKKISHCVI
ncbi:bifunctional anthranilate synthase component II/anthranilate phosphoribosyltransferase [Helicobacter cappadocius]|uniref:Anthranilate phosphoribosyltransferase n=1 Tax=Helicobacter cappadocius TaxID=3063998 RepID=A0AA90TBK8_9HELI|nr:MULTISPECIES: bifunctional anthranilate synthase component II/anthranilate phosphoribosyltransferase [unclassified Helicobacter]MDO7252823.1 bifunctional anthranilate synthase component II/anthranilate phosphoribosyltransferase [Helicobacter sp. faydin-H75]MDP2538866.1 bifunctional anthranilate synthase component II/anthranilate phosphoribosyltransferase [Helicobacter sp. faydin-H76]